MDNFPVPASTFSSTFQNASSRCIYLQNAKGMSDIAGEPWSLSDMWIQEKEAEKSKVAPWDYLLLYFHTAWVSLHQTLSVLPLASLRGLMFWIERYCDLEQIPLALYSGFHVGRVFWDASQISFTFKTTDWASAHLGIDGIMTIFSGTCRVSREECIWAYAEHLSLATSNPCISRTGGPVFWVKYCSQLPGRLILASLSWRTEIKHWIHVCEKNEFLPERLRWLTKTSKAT